MAQPKEGAADQVFLRKASGVVRAMSPADGMYYGYLSAAGLYGVALFLFVGPAAFPRANYFLSCVISLVIFLFVYVVYSILGSAMPRSGGDYVFTSRLLSPSIGFVIAQASWVFWQFFFSFLAASTIVSGLLPALFNAIGVATETDGWITLGTNITEVGVRLPIVIALILGAGWIMSRGMKPFLAIQKFFMMPASLIGVVLIILSFLLVSQGSFLDNFDTFQGRVGGLSSDEVMTQASELGWEPATGFSLGETFGFSVLLSFLFVWTIWSTELLGEMKSAGKLQSLFSSYLGAGVLVFITFAVGLAWTYAYAGREFMQAFSFMVNNHGDVLGGDWDFRGAPTLMYLPTLNLFVGVLIFLGFLGAISQSLFNTIVSSSRLMLAMSFDRLLPSWLGNVNRYGAPHVAIWGGTALSIVVALLLEASPGIADILFWSSWATLLGLLASLVAGTLFPSRMPDVYSVSPGAQYKIGGTPAVVIAGVISSAFILLSLIVHITDNDAFGLLDEGAARVGLWTMLGLLVGWGIYYFAIRRVRENQGIELGLAFETLPPE